MTQISDHVVNTNHKCVGCKKSKNEGCVKPAQFIGDVIAWSETNEASMNEIEPIRNTTTLEND